MARTTTAGTKGVSQQILSAAEAGKIALPPLPEIVTRLHEMLRDEARSNLSQISQLMQNDLAIASAVLRIANSAAFAGMGPLPDLDQAIQRLGLRQIGTLVTSIAHKANFHASSPARLELLHRLWERALVSAIATRHLIGERGGDRSEAYLAGLLHDSGKLLVLRGIEDIESGANSSRFHPDEVEALMEALHAVLGYTVLRSWTIGDRICRVALHHHQVEVPADDHLLLSVQASDAIARKLCPHRPSDSEFELARSRAIQALGFDESELAARLVDIEAEIDAARSLFD